MDELGNSQIVSSEAFWLDNTNPTITATNEYPENQNIDISGQIVTRYADVTLVVTDLNAGPEPETALESIYQYYLSTSNTQLVGSEWVTYESGTSFRIGENLTDTRYLFVKQILDNAGNISEDYGELTIITTGDYTGTYHFMGTYVFDNTIPDVSIAYDASVHQVYKQSQSVSATVGDNEAELPNAGINFANSIVKYEWTNDTTVLTSKEQFTNTMTTGTQSLIVSGYTGYKYLWIYAEDNIGNYTIVYPKDAEGNPYAFYLDNTRPVMNKVVTPTSSTENNVWKSANVTITFNEEHAGLLEETNPATIYQYYLSTSSTTLENGTLTNYTPGTEFEIGEDETGDRYLFVKAVKDKAGNESNTTTDLPMVEIDGQNYHIFGVYKFDNTAPSVEATYLDTHNVYQKSQTANVTLRDDNTIDPMTGEAGVKLSEVRYVWTKSTTAPTDKNAFPTENTITSLNQDITKENETGIFYLWLYVEDELGNNEIAGIKDAEGNLVEFWIDNTETELHVELTADPISSENVWKTANVTVTAADIEAGIDASKTYKYYLSTSATALENVASGTFNFQTDGDVNSKEQSFTIGENITDTRYLFVENIYDKAGNVTVKPKTQITLNGTTQAQIIDNVTIDGVTYHVFGLDTNPYKIDNSAPAVTITTSDTGEDWSREHTAEVTIVDVGLAGLDTNTFQYVWVNE